MTRTLLVLFQRMKDIRRKWATGGDKTLSSTIGHRIFCGSDTSCRADCWIPAPVEPYAGNLQPLGWNKYGGSTRLPRSSATGSHFHLLVARHLRYAMPGWPWSAWCQRMRTGFLPHGVCEHDHAVAKADGRTKDTVCNGNNPSCECSWLGSLPWSWPPLPRLSCAEHLGQNIFEDDYAFIVSDELPVLNRSFIIKDARLSPSVLWSACLQI